MNDMRVAVWVGTRPDEVRALLRSRAARPRRVVPSHNGTFILGPAPEDVQVLLDGMRVATTGTRAAVGFAWTERTSWLIVTTEHGTTGVRFGPDALSRPAVADADFRVPDHVTGQLALALGLDPDAVVEALRTTSGHGLPRLLDFLGVTGFGSEAQVLGWIGRAGADLVPVHGRRWPDLVFGELRQPRITGNQPLRPERGIVFSVLIGVFYVVTFAAALMMAAFARIALPWPWDLPVYLLVGVFAVAVGYGLVQLGLMTSRLRRPDPFPLSDPLGVLSS